MKLGEQRQSSSLILTYYLEEPLGAGRPLGTAHAARESLARLERGSCRSEWVKVNDEHGLRPQVSTFLLRDFVGLTFESPCFLNLLPGPPRRLGMTHHDAIQKQIRPFDQIRISFGNQHH